MSITVTSPAPAPAEADAWLPPEAPLAMPRQALERDTAAEGLLAALFRLIFTPLRG